MILDKIKTYRKGLAVERMHTVPHHTPYNNASHSCNAALIAYELCKLNFEKTERIILHILMHDVAEGYVGDTPANVKVDNPKLKEVLSRIEDNWERDNLLDIPTLNLVEHDIFKSADLIELGMYCLEELKMGNRNVITVLSNVTKYLTRYSGESAVRGVSDFVDLFNLTLARYSDEC